MKKFLTREVRKYVYAICVAVGPLLVALGLADPEIIAMSLPAVLALLNLTPADVESANE